jgi:hypothetical protein
MKVLNVKVLAKRNDPESCGGARKCVDEALTGVYAGCVLSREIPILGADAVEERGRQHWPDRHGEIWSDLARSETTRMHVSIMCGSREILWSSLPCVGKDRVTNPKGARSR